MLTRDTAVAGIAELRGLADILLWHAAPDGTHVAVDGRCPRCGGGSFTTPNTTGVLAAGGYVAVIDCRADGHCPATHIRAIRARAAGVQRTQHQVPVIGRETVA